MPKAKCPTCATIVTYADGYDPICPSCGFRGQAPRAQAWTAPASTAPPGFSAPPSDPVRHEAGNANGLAIGSLVCGIAGFLVGLTAPVAVILGIIALNQPATDGGSRTMAIIGIVLGALVTLGGLLAFMFIGSLFGGF